MLVQHFAQNATKKLVEFHIGDSLFLLQMISKKNWDEIFHFFFSSSLNARLPRDCWSLAHGKSG